MKTLSKQELELLLEGAQTIEEDGYGLKVARLRNGDFLKLYRRKRLLSSALWAPPAKLFARNAERLVALGITAPRIEDLLLIPERQLNGVRYQPLPGETLRQRWRALDSSARALDVQRFGTFLGELHEQGIYFRSLHLGNVLALPDDSFGLIDLSDMQIGSAPLSSWKRQRNLQHMLRYPEDRSWLTEQHQQQLLAGYRQRCGSAAADRLERALHNLSAGTK
ncbi:lipopolysaccharide kinase InaA family protein [Pseudomonas sp. Gutcm_11s]|uniref:lipopolysaccharide kinase InaA family protein n=1 Tax=Pseudomonas sp. Gutcm_11s TaxID=3026088 RepID=UPI002360EFCC|nr:lipopolysaccharide kinase InaA family protein [Pseudomonas sp. Gutcm_11s]MDD0842933.1 lipopolysaccharide kinase InaA family protein [Pseudomonas sp. Gutcm_11s]